MTLSRRSTLHEIGQKFESVRGGQHRMVSTGHPSIARSDYPGSVTVGYDSTDSPNVCIKLTFVHGSGPKTHFKLSYHQTYNLVMVLRSMIDFEILGIGGLPITSPNGRQLRCVGKFIESNQGFESVYVVSLEVGQKAQAELEAPGVHWLIKGLNVLAEDVPQLKGGKRHQIG